MTMSISRWGDAVASVERKNAQRQQGVGCTYSIPRRVAGGNRTRRPPQIRT